MEQEKTKNNEKSLVDVEYYKKINRLYSDRVEELGQTESEDYAAQKSEYLRLAQKELEKLSNNRKLEKLSPADVSMGLVDLSATEENIFLESCAKIFREKSVKAGNKTDIKIIILRLQGAIEESFKKEQDELNALLDNPGGIDDEKLLQRINAIYIRASNALLKLSTETHYDEGLTSEVRAKLAVGAEQLYALKLMEQQLQAKILNATTKQESNRAKQQDLQEAEKERAELEFQELLHEADKRGRLATHTSIDINFSDDRKVFRSGFQSFMDAKQNNPETESDTLKRIYETLTRKSSVGGYHDQLVDSKVNLTISMEPLTITENTTRQVKKTKKGWFGKETEETVNETTQTTRPVIASELNNNQEDTEPVYKITCFIVGTTDNTYFSDNGRGGNILNGNILLPESIAKKVFAELQYNPAKALDVLRKMDPEMIARQESYGMCKIKKAMVIPEGEMDKAFPKRSPQENARIVNPDYVRDIKP